MDTKMSTDIAITEKNAGTDIIGAPREGEFDLDTAWRKARYIAASGMFGLTKPEDVMTIMLTGHDLGLAPTVAIRSMHIIKGRPFLSADAMVMLVLRSEKAEYFEPKELTEKTCTYITKRKGSPNEASYTFSIDDAKRAGLLGNDNWSKWTKDMLRARAASKLARMVYPDVILGVFIQGEESDFVDVEVAPRPSAKDLDAEIMGAVDVEVAQ